MTDSYYIDNSLHLHVRSYNNIITKCKSQYCKMIELLQFNTTITLSYHTVPGLEETFNNTLSIICITYSYNRLSDNR